MKAVLDTSGKTWVPIVVTITIDTEEEYHSLRNIYTVQEVTSLEPEHKVRDRNMLTNLINLIVTAINKK